MSSVGVSILSVFSFVGGFGLAIAFVYMMDCLSKPGERRRQLELAANRATKAALRIKVLEKLFPEKVWRPVVRFYYAFLGLAIVVLTQLLTLP